MDYSVLLHECKEILNNTKVPRKKPEKREYFNNKPLIYCEGCGTSIAETNSSNYCAKCRPKHLMEACKNPACQAEFEVHYPGQYQYCPDCRYRGDGDTWNSGSVITKVRREGKWWDQHTEQIMHYYGNWWV